MAAPIYSQAEADAMIAMPKRVELDAWEKSDPGRLTIGEPSREIILLPEDNSDEFSFKMELRTSNKTEYFSVTLKAKMVGRTWEGLCRYDIQDNEHTNPSCCKALTIAPGEYHRHLYCEQAVRSLDRWDACAEPVAIESTDSFEQQAFRLRTEFLTFLKVKFSDSKSQTGYLFGEI